MTPDGSPIPAPPACPVCADAAVRSFALAQDRLFGKAEGRFRLLRCSSCGCIYQHPFPECTDLASFYPESYWWAGPRRKGIPGFLSRLEQVYREFVGQGHVRFLEGCAAGIIGRRLLDIGCGSGTFLHLARKRGFEPHGLDMSREAVATAQAQYGLPVRQGDIGGEAWKGDRFDFITMFHVLEHLPDPRQALEAAGRLLTPGGRLILQVPNVSSLQARIFGARWYGLDVPRHLINFTPRGLALMLDRAGFTADVAARFSLRDNPAALASSLAIGLDPIGRRGRGRRRYPIVEEALELVYFALFLLSTPPALLESWCGYGATLWVQAQKAPPR